MRPLLYKHCNLTEAIAYINITFTYVRNLTDWAHADYNNVFDFNFSIFAYIRTLHSYICICAYVYMIFDSSTYICIYYWCSKFMQCIISNLDYIKYFYICLPSSYKINNYYFKIISSQLFFIAMRLLYWMDL